MDIELTARQRECLQLVWDGQTSKQIAITLGIRHSTVNDHVELAMKRLGARTRHAAAKALYA